MWIRAGGGERERETSLLGLPIDGNGGSSTDSMGYLTREWVSE